MKEKLAKNKLMTTKKFGQLLKRTQNIISTNKHENMKLESIPGIFESISII